MKDIVVPNGQDPLSVMVGSGEPGVDISPVSDTLDQTFTPAQPVRSYHPYSWDLINHVLDIVDQKTNGRAGLAQRLISYLFFGGLAAGVNLGMIYVTYYHVFTGLPLFLHNTLSYVVAAEVSILANFIPNDRFTFQKLPGAQRPWIQRCLRFHLTALVGTGLTYCIELLLTNTLHTEIVVAEAIATIIVLAYNFTFHHVFTYRHVKHA